MAVTPNTTKITSAYLYNIFQHKNISDFASQSNPPSMRQGAVEEWQIPLPALQLQQAFGERYIDLRSIIAQQERSLAAARELERLLMTRLLG